MNTAYTATHVIYEPTDYAGGDNPHLCIIRRDALNNHRSLVYVAIKEITFASQRRLLAVLISMGAAFTAEGLAFVWDYEPDGYVQTLNTGALPYYA